MRPVQKYLKKISAGKADKDYNKCLLKLGNHCRDELEKLLQRLIFQFNIDHTSRKPKSNLRKWYNYVWIFASRFIPNSDPAELAEKYKELLQSHHKHKKEGKDDKKDKKDKKEKVKEQKNHEKKDHKEKHKEKKKDKKEHKKVFCWRNMLNKHLGSPSSSSPPPTSASSESVGSGSAAKLPHSAVDSQIAATEDAPFRCGPDASPAESSPPSIRV